jgi:tellurium resistance protein TerD
MATNLLTKGGNVTLPAGITELLIGLSWEAPGPTYDLDAWTFMLDADGRVPSDQHFIFFNNMQSPCGTVRVSEDSQEGGSEGEDDEAVTVKLTEVPANIDRIVFVVNIHEGLQKGQNFGQLDNSAIRLVVQTSEGPEEIARYNLGDEDVSTETSLVFGELYRRNGEWKFRAIAQGHTAGPAKLAREYGVDIGDDDSEAVPAPAAPIQAPPADVPKVNLSKGKINLTKDGAAARIAVTPAMEFSLYWTKSHKDLGLILLVTHKDGTKCSYDWRCLQDGKGEILHHGDRKEGGKDIREYATVRLRQDTTISAFAIVAYSELKNGTGSFKSMGAFAVIDDGSGTQVNVDLNKGGTFSYHTVIASVLVHDDGTVTVRRESRFSKSGKEERPEIDQHGNISMNTGPVVFKPNW